MVLPSSIRCRCPHRRERVFVVAHPQGQPWGSGDGEYGVAANADGATIGQQSPESPREETGPYPGDRPGHHGRERPAEEWRETSNPEASLTLLPTPIAERPDGHKSAAFTAGHTTFRDVIDRNRWGEFAPAIARWESTLGRPAPEPSEPGREGRRLSARFVEWMMGLPDGWVTDVDISRTAQLRALGNGVVPQQAAAALKTLLMEADTSQVMVA